METSHKMADLEVSEPQVVGPLSRTLCEFLDWGVANHKVVAYLINVIDIILYIAEGQLFTGCVAR